MSAAKAGTTFSSCGTPHTGAAVPAAEMPAAEVFDAASTGHSLGIDILRAIAPARLAGLDAFAPHGRVLLAVSGGPDSTALMLLAAHWRRARGAATEFHVATVDHGLRPEARMEAAAVARLAGQFGLSHAVLSLPHPLPGTRLQEAARHARYDRLLAHAREISAGAIATAHTRDDQAETVLFRLMRGSGLSGLSGIAAARPLDELHLLRPLLDWPKADLVALCEAAGVGFARDSSNHDPRFARSRLRALMPALAAEGLDAARLSRLAARMARAESALAEAAREASARLTLSAAPMRLDRAGWQALPEEISLRVLDAGLLAVADGRIELAKLEALQGWIRGLEPEESGARTLAGALVRVSHRSLAFHRAPARRGHSSDV